MKPALTFFLVVLSIMGPWRPSAHAAAGGLEMAEFAGQRYVRLNDWARAYGFDLRWVQRDQVVQLTNRAFRLVFEKDSKNSEFNDINVLLSFPVVVKNGAAYVAELDLRTTLAPLLSPPVNPGGSRIRNIVIDPGHGGKDPGFQVGSYQEKKYTLLLAQELRDQLKKAGFNVSLTRTSDTYVDLAKRPDVARQRGADLFISLHWNSTSTGRNEVKGVQTYCVTPPGAPSSNANGEVPETGAQPGNRNNDKNLFLAYQLQKSLVQELGADDHGVRRARFMVLTQAQMPAILIEGGYMSHPAESKKIFDPAYRRQMARAIVDGVMVYKRQVEPPPPPSAPWSGSVTNSTRPNSHNSNSR